jgi:putative transposase
MGTVEVMQLRSASEGKSKGFDYRGMHRYLVTLPSFRNRQVFLDDSRITPVLDALRVLATEQEFDVFAYCFLPDRLIVLLHGRTRSSDLRAFLPAFRARATELLEPLLGHALWKRSYLERVLTRSSDSAEVARQVFRLPVSAGLARTAQSYRYLGSFSEDVERLLQVRPRPFGRPKARPPGPPRKRWGRQGGERSSRPRRSRP